MIDHYDFKPMIVFDTTHKFSIVPKMNHVGITRCKKPREGKICLKIHTPEQLEAVIEKLNNGDSPFFLVIDEIDRFTSPNTLLPETKLYLEEGRNWNRGGVFSVRRHAHPLAPVGRLSTCRQPSFLQRERWRRDHRVHNRGGCPGKRDERFLRGR
jgi:hypothetical protein